MRDVIPHYWAEIEARLSDAGVDVDGSELRKGLAPPLALLLAIEAYFPKLLARERLKVAVIGAEWLDALDEGRWYALAAAILTQPLQLTGVLIGPALERGSIEAAAPALSRQRPFERYRGTLQEYLAAHGAKELDAAVLFQPGLDSGGELLANEAVAALLRAGIPVVGSSYSQDEFAMEDRILSACGYVSRGPTDNPLSLDVGREEARWGAILWALQPTQTAATAIDTAAVEAVQRLSRMLAHSKLHGLLIPLARLGEVFCIPRAGGGEREMIYLFDGFYAARDSGEVFAVDESRLRRTERRLARADLDSYPGPEAEAIERALWCARMKESRLLRG